MRVLEETKWIPGGPHGATARLGIKRTTLQSLLEQLGPAVPRSIQRRGARPASLATRTGAMCTPRCEAVRAADETC
jgi:hypothetical protein